MSPAARVIFDRLGVTSKLTIPEERSDQAAALRAKAFTLFGQ